MTFLIFLIGIKYKQFYFLFANILVIIVTKITIDIELNGIRIAATMGDKFPVTANSIPMKLYIKDKTKLIFITVMVCFDNFINLGISSN